ncbi:MAG: L-threonylcarbamoyladenylate synthase [Salibacteraceae bacterium]
MKTKDDKDILKAVKAGKTLLYPTETVWGLGCDASNEEAVNRIFNLKQRSDSKSLVCLVSDDAMLNRLIPEIPEIAWELFDETDKPLTLVLPNAKGLAKNVGAEDGSVAVRIIRSGPVHKLIYNFRKPIVSTSANISGQPSTRFQKELSSTITDGVDVIADWEESQMTGKPSSIIKIEVDGQFKILRH